MKRREDNFGKKTKKQKKKEKITYGES